MTRDEFEEAYATRSGVTVEWLHEQYREARPCRCGEEGCEGWQMAHLRDEPWWREHPEADRPRPFGAAMPAEPRKYVTPVGIIEDPLHDEMIAIWLDHGGLDDELAHHKQWCLLCRDPVAAAPSIPGDDQ